MSELTPQEFANKHRHPELIISDAYLLDPIKFANDSRFDPESALKETLNGLTISRDQANFAVVDLGAKVQQLYTAEMYSLVYNRDVFATIFNTTFGTL